MSSSESLIKLRALLGEFKFDLFLPRYRPMNHGDWSLRITPLCIVPGYWSGPVLVSGMAALERHGSTWMSMTPFELESQEIGVRMARGHVLIFGMGMGWSAAASALNPDVTMVTVVERDRDVLALHNELKIFEQLPAAAQTKIRILQADAFDYLPDASVDLLMADIWLPLVNDQRVRGSPPHAGQCPRARNLLLGSGDGDRSSCRAREPAVGSRRNPFHRRGVRLAALGSRTARLFGTRQLGSTSLDARALVPRQRTALVKVTANYRPCGLILAAYIGYAPAHSCTVPV